MRYHNITKDDMLNGDGLRVVLWVSGCDHRCAGCHNPITWDENTGVLFDEAARMELFQQLDKEYISGITYSGGDPLYAANRDEVTRLAKEIWEKYPDKTQWLYTGYQWEEIQELDCIRYIDVIVDGKFLPEQKDTQLHWRGSTNQRVIDVPKSREQGLVVLHQT